MDLTAKKQSKRRSRKSAAADFKVVYISNPMKVKTSASRFRSLVQKLTGLDSDAERFMELIAAAASSDRNNLQSSTSASAFLDYQLLGDDDLTDCDHRLVAGKIETAAYQSSVAPPEDLVMQNFDASFAEMFQSFLHESSSTQTEMPGFSALL
ncbi:sigma factor binding protein 1, chloroplastic-like [Cucurbita pepo subsp. pepo]|uniref:sigma factor binding protein 1, chloroplastic-like n=1 Tax=Cucurbita pepo subsp. pepo TaxID=3664 RepID=UPI000C9D50D6|nr:sigma factor binding protein 1, chloroplastic-like [Cucurbita pepo subsp. pepo]